MVTQSPVTMREFLSIGFRPILHALILWIPVFIGTVLALGYVLWRFVRVRIRRAAAGGSRPVPWSRVWTIRLTLLLTQVVFLPLVALVMAVPFALHMGAAKTIETASSNVLDWGMESGVGVLRERFQIVDDEAVVDLTRIEPTLRSIPPLASRARGILGVLSSTPRLATNAYLSAVNAVVEGAAQTDLRITWRDVFDSARKQVGVVWTGQARILAHTLRVSSLHFLHALAEVVAILDLACLALILLLTERNEDAPLEPPHRG